MLNYASRAFPPTTLGMLQQPVFVLRWAEEAPKNLKFRNRGGMVSTMGFVGIVVMEDDETQPDGM